MSRPKKNTPEGRLATERWRETIAKKYGDNYKELLAEWAAKGGRNGKGPGYKGGFANDRNKAREYGRIGGKISKRGCKLIGRTEDGEYIYERMGAQDV